MAAGKIFINYRREDSRADAGRLYDRLHARYPTKVFRDVGSLEPGIEWREAINKVLADSDACMVVIGKHWLTVTDSQGKRRLDDPRDTVRQELQTALTTGIRVFPILVGGATMPAEEDLPEDLRGLARRNAIELSEQDWHEDFEKLVGALERALGWSRPKRPTGSRTALLAAGGVAGLLVLAIGIALLSGVWGAKIPSRALELGKTPPAQPELNKTPPVQQELDKTSPAEQKSLPPPQPAPGNAVKASPRRDTPVTPAGATPQLPSRPVVENTREALAGGPVVHPREDSAHPVRIQVVHRHGFNHRINKCEGWLTIEPNGTVSYECDPKFPHNSRCDQVSFPPGSFTFTAEDDDQLHLATAKGNYDFFAQESTIATAVRALGVVGARRPPGEREEEEKE